MHSICGLIEEISIKLYGDQRISLLNIRNASYFVYCTSSWRANIRVNSFARTFDECALNNAAKWHKNGAQWHWSTPRSCIEDVAKYALLLITTCAVDAHLGWAIYAGTAKCRSGQVFLRQTSTWLKRWMMNDFRYSLAVFLELKFFSAHFMKHGASIKRKPHDVWWYSDPGYCFGFHIMLFIPFCIATALLCQVKNQSKVCYGWLASSCCSCSAICLVWGVFVL